jgi:hypothetical protein
MHDKVKQILTKHLNLVKEQSFEEEAILLLMIGARDFFDNKSIAYELANFLVHPKRKTGILHNNANIGLTKYVLIDDQAEQLTAKIRETIETNQDLSKFLLSRLNVENVDARLFDLIYIKGMDDMDEEILYQYTEMNRQAALQFLKQHYTKKNGIYYLDMEKVHKTSYGQYTTFIKFAGQKALSFSKFKESEFCKPHADILIFKLDNLQKTLRGYIKFKVIEFGEIKEDFINSFQLVLEKLGLDQAYLEDIKKNINDIFLCIFTLLHDKEFHFDNGSTAETLITFYHDYDIEQMRNDGNFGSVENDGVIALCLKHPRLRFPLIISDLKASEYFDFDMLTKEDAVGNMDKIPWTTATRINGKLKLTKIN